MSTWTAERPREPEMPGYGHAVWALLRALLATGLLLLPAGMLASLTLARWGLPLGMHIGHGWRDAGTWMLGSENRWFVLTNLAASATVTVLCARLFQWAYRTDAARLPFATAAGASLAALALGSLGFHGEPSGSWLLAVLLVAAFARGEPRVAARRLGGMRARRLLFGSAAVWAILVGGCFVETNLHPLGQAPGYGGGVVDGSGLLSPSYRDAQVVFPYRAGKSGEVTAFAMNRSWTHPLTVLAADPRGGLRRAPWRVAMIRDDAWPDRFAAAAPVRIPPLATRALTLRLHFTGCRAGMTGVTFTLDQVRFRLAGGGEGVVGLPQAVVTTCP